MRTRATIIFALLLTFGINGFGQIQRGNGDTLSTENVIIVKEFEPTISNAIKITDSPKRLDVKPEKMEFDYKFIPTNFQTSYLPDTIKAARIKGEPLNRLYRGYAELGMGNYLTTYGKVRLNNTRSRNGRWGVALDHLSSQGEIEDVPFSGYSNNSASVYGTRFFKSHQLKGDVNYSRDVHHNYGYPEFFSDSVIYDYDDIGKDEIKRIYNNLNATASFASFHADSQMVNYRFDAEYDYLFTSLDDAVQEHHVKLNSTFSRYFGSELGVIDINTDYNDQTIYDSAYNDPNLFVEVNPKIEVKGKKWRAKFGISAFIENENETDFRFYPDVFVNYNIYEDYIIPYAGIDGGLERVNLNSLRQENRFVATRSTVENKNTRYNFYGGVRGAFTSELSFNLKAARKQIANNPFFGVQNMFTPTSVDEIYRDNGTFNVVYDTMNVTQLTAEVSYFHAEKINATARIDYYSYDPNNLPKAWHMPKFKATLSGRYNMRDKIIATADIFAVTDRYAQTLYESNSDEQVANGIYAQKLPTYVDINLGIEYRYNKKISAFLKGYNLASMQYNRWMNYPVQRISVLAGFTYSFWGD
ncbi:hypothetical protein [Salibacter sp.]|uniref:hypothetical protein n=1 Tax=Salibacter sp. TaxID=2010995 RepID=UPI00287059F5|nr:hypothetical protein [Salibacter sp.]MDR9486509.1 hypothetical protein [Salibacter sp.]